MPDALSKKPWRKILYERQDYPDNHVGPQFLDQLERNRHVQPSRLGEVVSASTVVVQQLISVSIFGLVYRHLLLHPHDDLPAAFLVGLTGALLAVNTLLRVAEADGTRWASEWLSLRLRHPPARRDSFALP